MKILVSTAIAAALLVTLPACDRQPTGDGNAVATAEAASLEALNGNWKVDLASLKFSGRPDEYLLKDGSYSCVSCTPPISLAADGQFHPVPDRPYFDSMSVKVVDDRTVQIRRQEDGKDASTVEIKLSEDGNSMTAKFRDMTNPAKTIEGSSTAKRVGPAPAGAHAMSGKWQPDRVGEYSQDALDISFQVTGDTVTSNFQGQSYTATLGGPAVPVQGDTGGTTVKVERDGNGIKETYVRGGKEVSVSTITPGADGQSINITSTDPRDGTSTSLTAKKAG